MKKDDRSASAPLAARVRTVGGLAKGERACTACELYQRATQAVPGEGKAEARIMLVGEQPGNDEDLAGHPFVGPAGRLLDAALEAAGVPKSAAFITNAVKHFNWEGTKGDRRLHAHPKPPHIRACFGWLEKEIDLVEPEVIVCLGAIAAKVFLGSKFSITRDHGKDYPTEWAPHLLATFHPAAALRAPDHDARARLRAAIFEDVAKAARIAGFKKPR